MPLDHREHPWLIASHGLFVELLLGQCEAAACVTGLARVPVLLHPGVPVTLPPHREFSVPVAGSATATVSSIELFGKIIELRAAPFGAEDLEKDRLERSALVEAELDDVVEMCLWFARRHP